MRMKPKYILIVEMAYIHNGRVVDKKPFSLFDFLASLWSLVVVFFRSIFSAQPLQTHVEDYRDSRRPGRSRGDSASWGRSLRSLFRPGGGDTTGRGDNSAAAINRRGNVHTLPPSALSGGCGGGG